MTSIPSTAPWSRSSADLYPTLSPSAPPLDVSNKPQTDEQVSAFLSGYDFFILIDKSTSMKWEVEKGTGVSRWEETKECLKLIARESTDYDKNGVDVCFFGSHTEWHKNVESEKKVDSLFNSIHPRGSTNLTEALQETFAEHTKRKEENSNQKSIVLVVTDGSPDDQESTEKAIKHFTSKGLDHSRCFQYRNSEGEMVTKTTEFGIRFFQVGDDPEATEFLKVLDKKLHAKVDIIATGNIEEMQSEKMVHQAFLQAIYD